jgi:predicted phosphoadenosine phosphosulfate sulfurtransferase
VKSKLLQYIRVWESRGYPGGIPDEAPAALEARNRVPSYRAICRAIMNNDVALASLGYQREPCAAYNALKRIELRARGVIPSAAPKQMRLTGVSE